MDERIMKLLTEEGADVTDRLMREAIAETHDVLARHRVTAEPDAVRMFAAGMLALAAQTVAGIPKDNADFGRLLEIVMTHVAPEAVAKGRQH